jgi:putative transcriptional regulator
MLQIIAYLLSINQLHFSTVGNIMSETPTKLRQAIGKRIRVLRATHDMTQADLEDKSGVHRTQISAFERGTQSLSVENAARIAKAFKMSLGDFFKEL